MAVETLLASDKSVETREPLFKDKASAEAWLDDTSHIDFTDKAKATLSALGQGISTGITKQIPAQTGQAFQAGRPEQPEGEAESWATRKTREAEEAAQESAKDIRPTLFDATAGQLKEETAANIPQMAPPVVGALAGAAAGAPFAGVGAVPGALGGLAAGSLAGLGGMYESTKTQAASKFLEDLDRKRKAEGKPPMTKAERLAEQERMQPDVEKYGRAEIVPELVGTGIEMIPGVGPLVGGAAKLGAPVLRRLVSKAAAKEFAKGTAKEAAVIAATEPAETAASDIMERGIENKYAPPGEQKEELSLAKPADWMKAYKEAVGPTLRGMIPMMVFGSLAAGGSHVKGARDAGHQFVQNGLAEKYRQYDPADPADAKVLDTMIANAESLAQRPDWKGDRDLATIIADMKAFRFAPEEKTEAEADVNVEPTGSAPTESVPTELAAGVGEADTGIPGANEVVAGRPSPIETPGKPAGEPGVGAGEQRGFAVSDGTLVPGVPPVSEGGLGSAETTATPEENVEDPVQAALKRRVQENEPHSVLSQAALAAGPPASPQSQAQPQTPEETGHAVETGRKPESDKLEHPRVGAIGTAPEAGGGNRHADGGRAEEGAVGEPEAGREVAHGEGPYTTPQAAEAEQAEAEVIPPPVQEVPESAVSEVGIAEPSVEVPPETEVQEEEAQTQATPETPAAVPPPEEPPETPIQAKVRAWMREPTARHILDQISVDTTLVRLYDSEGELVPAVRAGQALRDIQADRGKLISMYEKLVTCHGKIGAKVV